LEKSWGPRGRVRIEARHRANSDKIPALTIHNPDAPGMAYHIRSEAQVHRDRRDLHNLRNLLPFLWEYRGRALFALGCLVFAKLANVGIPLLLKLIVDSLERGEKQVLVLPLFLLLAYGLLRLASTLFNELRDAIFARVRYRAMRNLSQRERVSS